MPSTLDLSRSKCSRETHERRSLSRNGHVGGEARPSSDPGGIRADARTAKRKSVHTCLIRCSFDAKLSNHSHSHPLVRRDKLPPVAVNSDALVRCDFSIRTRAFDRLSRLSFLFVIHLYTFVVRLVKIPGYAFDGERWFQIDSLSFRCATGLSLFLPRLLPFFVAKSIRTYCYTCLYFLPTLGLSFEWQKMVLSFFRLCHLLCFATGLSLSLSF